MRAVCVAPAAAVPPASPSERRTFRFRLDPAPRVYRRQQPAHEDHLEQVVVVAALQLIAEFLQRLGARHVAVPRAKGVHRQRLRVPSDDDERHPPRTLLLVALRLLQPHDARARQSAAVGGVLL